MMTQRTDTFENIRPQCSDKDDKEEEERDNLQCVICLQNFNDKDKVTGLSCHERHVFHAQCLKMAL